jgi:putative FmdB family regulatory protein
MPIYEYQCKECRHRFEYLLLRASAEAKCPVCNSLNLEQLISRSAVHSEGMHQANLDAAHRKVAAARGDRVRDEHQHLHEHFEDRATRAGPSLPDHGTKNSQEE